jgi:hypothetical protein
MHGHMHINVYIVCVFVCVQVLLEKPTLAGQWLACAGIVSDDDDDDDDVHTAQVVLRGLKGGLQAQRVAASWMS